MFFKSILPSIDTLVTGMVTTVVVLPSGLHGAVQRGRKVGFKQITQRSSCRLSVCVKMVLNTLNKLPSGLHGVAQRGQKDGIKKATQWSSCRLSKCVKMVSNKLNKLPSGVHSGSTSAWRWF